jgi:hypothetical protein
MLLLSMVEEPDPKAALRPVDHPFLMQAQIAPLNTVYVKRFFPIQTGCPGFKPGRLPRLPSEP